MNYLKENKFYERQSCQIYADKFSENNLIISKTLADINALINHDLDKVNQIVKNNAGNFITIVLVISLVGLLIILFIGIIITRLIDQLLRKIKSNNITS